MGCPIVVAGPSGAGKSHLISDACRRDSTFTRVPSVTTRRPRQGEVHGVDKVFLSETEFQERSGTGALICIAENFGAMYAHDAEVIAACKAFPIIELSVDSSPEFVARFPDTQFVFVTPTDADAADRAVAGRLGDGTSAEARRADLRVWGPIGTQPEITWISFVNSYDDASCYRFLQTLRTVVAAGRSTDSDRSQD